MTRQGAPGCAYLTLMPELFPNTTRATLATHERLRGEPRPSRGACACNVRACSCPVCGRSLTPPLQVLGGVSCYRKFLLAESPGSGHNFMLRSALNFKEGRIRGALKRKTTRVLCVVMLEVLNIKNLSYPSTGGVCLESCLYGKQNKNCYDIMSAVPAFRANGRRPRGHVLQLRRWSLGGNAAQRRRLPREFAN